MERGSRESSRVHARSFSPIYEEIAHTTTTTTTTAASDDSGAAAAAASSSTNNSGGIRSALNLCGGSLVNRRETPTYMPIKLVRGDQDFDRDRNVRAREYAAKGRAYSDLIHSPMECLNIGNNGTSSSTNSSSSSSERNNNGLQKTASTAAAPATMIKTNGRPPLMRQNCFDHDRCIRSRDECGLYNIPRDSYTPMYLRYATSRARANSFVTWPRAMCALKEPLVSAGFFYTGRGDCCTCFFCGGTLHQWEFDDVPLSEHLRIFPHCLFANQMAKLATVSVTRV